MALSFLKMKNKPVAAVEQTAATIDILDAVEAIRKRVSYYAGSSDGHAIFQIIKEPADNGFDEANAGRNNFVGVWVETGHKYTVWDNGGGIPIDIHTKSKQPVIIDLFTKLHVGGKFGSAAYDSAEGTKGTHGVGVKLTNAVSSKLDVWSFKNEKWHHIGFKKGRISVPLNTKTKPPQLPLKASKGTILQFVPDFSCFDDASKLSLKTLKDYLQLQAFLHPRVKVFLKTPKNEYTFQEKEGLKALLEKQIETLGEEALGKPVVLSENGVYLAFAWTKNSGEHMASYVSGSATKSGGTHVNGLNNAIRDAIKPYKGKFEFAPAEIRDGLVGTINVSVKEPKFTSQSKEELASDYVAQNVYDVVKPALDEFFKSNKTLTKLIVQRAADLHKTFAKFTADRKSIAALKNKTAKALVSSKLAKAKTKDLKRIELFLVEGDSAGGSAKQARNKEYQAVLALKGKILNAFRASPEKLFNNEEIRNICYSIGFELDAKNPIEKLRVGKIILLADPDVDGKHITNLMLSFFQKVFPETFDRGHVYTCDTPLFYCQRPNGDKLFGASLKDVEEKMKNKNYKIPPEGVQRIKGYGEIDPDTMEIVAFDPKTRVLTKMLPVKGKDAEKFALLVSDDTSARKSLLGV